jgi:lipid-A-disaccharide synthase-like uncharacterized protein
LKKRFKWEPIALVLIVVGLGMWLVWGSRDTIYGIKPAPGARRIELRIANSRGIVEVTGHDTTEPMFRVILRGDTEARPAMTGAEFKRFFGEKVYAAAMARAENPLFRLFNVTGWIGVVWVSVGLLGQLAFTGRMLVQWVVSEKRRESVVPEVFWWLSLAGGMMLFAYFVWRQDIVGVLGQSSGVVIYGRNLRLIHKQKRRTARAAAAQPPQPSRPANDGPRSP